MARAARGTGGAAGPCGQQCGRVRRSNEAFWALLSYVRVLRGHPLLDEAALQAVRRWAYVPTLLNGVPVPVVMTVTVNFRLE